MLFALVDKYMKKQLEGKQSKEAGESAANSNATKTQQSARITCDLCDYSGNILYFLMHQVCTIFRHHH